LTKTLGAGVVGAVRLRHSSSDCCLGAAAPAHLLAASHKSTSRASVAVVRSFAVRPAIIVQPVNKLGGEKSTTLHPAADLHGSGWKGWMNYRAKRLECVQLAGAVVGLG
jgi:hypothetical protein